MSLPDGTWQGWAVTSCRYQNTELWVLSMTLGGLGLVNDGRQEDARWFLWFVACKEAEEELGLCPASSLMYVVKSNNKS